MSTLRIPVALPVRAAMDHLDVLHMTYIAPPVSMARLVVTVHDIAYALYPQMFSWRDRALLKSLVPLSLRRAAEITTVSESSRRDIARYYRISEERITVINNSVSPAFRRLPDRQPVEAAKQRYGIRGQYVLAVGNLQPRKNLSRLIRAFASLRRAGAYEGRLVLVGRSRWRGSLIQQEIHALGLQSQVVCTGYVSEADVVALYNGADVFVYPSLYEGFGLPPLEAMACGCPVVTGDRSSLPEVVDTAGLMVDPTCVDELADAMLRLIRDGELRNTLIGRGQARAAHFTAERTARAMMALYQRAATKDRRDRRLPRQARRAST
jgi:glycosyltransferase involved in cell wall biosynthesis